MYLTTRLFLLSCVLATLVFIADAQNSSLHILPPVIVTQPNSIKTHYYTQWTSVTLLPCVATGSPGITFKWQRNRLDVQAVAIPKTIDIQEIAVYYNAQPTAVNGRYNGSLVIVGTGEILTGSYQCFASLTVAPKVQTMSEFGYVHTQTFSSFSDADLKLRTVHVTVGAYVTLLCPKLRMSPPPEVTWSIADKPTAPLIDGQRIVLDDKGTLHILSVMVNGSEFSGQLQCVQHNAEMGATARGRNTQLVLDTSVQPSLRAPKLVYITESPAIVISDSVSNDDPQAIHCIFSGNPSPTVLWSRADGKPLGAGLERNGAHLLFKNVSIYDFTVYKCLANSSFLGDSNPIAYTISVNVYSKPRVMQVQPAIVNRTVGDDVTFDCLAYGVPAAAYQWYINSVPEKDHVPDVTESGSTRFVDVSKLTISRLSKVDDLTVATCNTSNLAGSVLNTIAIKVYNKTSIVASSSLVYASLNESATLSCTADADATLPLEIYWTRKGSSNTRVLTVPEQKVYVYTSDRGKTIRLELDLPSMNDSQRLYWASGPPFECVANSSLVGPGGVARASVTVVLPDLPVLPPDATTDAVIAGDTVMAAGFELWMLGIIIGVAVLVALIIAVVCVLRRQRGGSYKVDAKERAQGNDPLKELRRDGFNDYVRPDQDPSKSIRQGLEEVDNDVGVESDEEDSMAEYGQADAARFDEDGSFIGQYSAPERSAAKSSAPRSKPSADQRSATPNSVLRGSLAAGPPEALTYPAYDVDKSPLLGTPNGVARASVSPSNGAVRDSNSSELV